MIINIQPKEIIDLYETPIVQQTSFWSKVKQRQGINSKAFEFKVRNSDLYQNVGGYSCTQADFILFFQYFNNEDCVAYIPYGPEIEPSEENQGIFLEELSETLRSYLPKQCIALKYDLNWHSHWAHNEDFDDNHNWMEEPDKMYQEFRLNYCTRDQKLKKSNNNVLPVNTIILDIRQSEEQILASMRPKTRYNIHLAARKGVKVKSVGIEGLEVWYKLYCETVERNRLNVNDFSYFQTVFTKRMENQTGNVKVKLLIAYVDNMPLAAMFLILSSHRATYLYGASSGCMRNFMPTYALQWNAILLAKEHNCTEYDMFGIAPRAEPSHPMYGLYKFKKGFGGDIYHQLGCWDYPLNDKKYTLLQAYEMKLQGYYL